jgi:UDP-glucose 4-epimerase
MDTRDLNYSCYFTEGATKISVQDEYNSHNTERLDTDELIELLMKQGFVNEALKTGRMITLE